MLYARLVSVRSCALSRLQRIYTQQKKLQESFCASQRGNSCFDRSYLRSSVTRATTAVTTESKTTKMANLSVEEAYDSLAKILKDISSLSGISGLLGWDEMVMLPEGSADARGAQKSALASVLHEKSTDPRIGELLARLQEDEASKVLDKYQKATVREAAREYKKAIAIPDALVRREAELETRAYATWVKARQENDWNKFAVVLKEWVEIRKERARLIDPTKPPYDVLADDYSAGLTADRVQEIFSTVKASLVPLLARIRENGTAPDATWITDGTKAYDLGKQADLCREIAIALGFDLQKGRLDVSVHPFTGGAHPTDVRMTTRFKEHDVMEGLTGAIHETGHALYEQGRNLSFDGLPVNSSAGMAIHESQSLLWERQVALSLPFAGYLLPKLRDTFPDIPADKTPEDLYQACNIIKEPSKIRVEADEVTYPMHIMLRFEIEKGLIDGSINVEDVPALWNERMKEYLGVTVENDAEGCLQDVHWSAGLFGYFPTYTLGAMSATQIFETAKRELPNLEADIEAGHFKGLKEWLNTKIHSVGSLYPTADDLLEAVTGKPLDPEYFLKYIQQKYSALYKI